MDYREYGTGYIPDPRDLRDFVVKAAVSVEGQSVFYDHLMLPPRNQKNEGTCVGFAFAALKEYYDAYQRHKMDYFSPRYLYNRCKQIDGIPDLEGTYPRVALKVLQDYGVAYEFDWPYAPHQTDQPGKCADIRANLQKIQSFARLYSTRDMVANLVLNGPFGVGLIATGGFYTSEAVRTGIIDPNIKATDDDGGHAMCVVGYDHVRDMFKARNSWGTDYGDDGYNWFTRSWAALNIIDAWAIVDDTAIDQGLIVAQPVGV